jgi:hypothetical protein
LIFEILKILDECDYQNKQEHHLQLPEKMKFVAMINVSNQTQKYFCLKLKMTVLFHDSLFLNFKFLLLFSRLTVSNQVSQELTMKVKQLKEEFLNYIFSAPKWIQKKFVLKPIGI